MIEIIILLGGIFAVSVLAAHLFVGCQSEENCKSGSVHDRNGSDREAEAWFSSRTAEEAARFGWSNSNDLSSWDMEETQRMTQRNMEDTLRSMEETQRFTEQQMRDMEEIQRADEMARLMSTGIEFGGYNSDPNLNPGLNYGNSFGPGSGMDFGSSFGGGMDFGSGGMFP